MKPKLVKIDWEDINSENSWKTLEEAKTWAEEEDDKICHTNGWLLEKNERYVVIGVTKDNDKKYSSFHGFYCIPIHNVKKITPINEKSIKK